MCFWKGLRKSVLTLRERRGHHIAGPYAWPMNKSVRIYRPVSKFWKVPFYTFITRRYFLHVFLLLPKVVIHQLIQLPTEGLPLPPGYAGVPEVPMWD